MDLLDKVLLEWSVRCEKGYPDFNNEQDLAIFESLFGFKLLENRFSSNSIKAAQYIADSPEGKANDVRAFKSRDYANRINLLTIKDPEEVKIFLGKIFDIDSNTIAAIPPRGQGNPSNTYYAYAFDSKKFGEVLINVSTGKKGLGGKDNELIVINAVKSYTEEKEPINVIIKGPNGPVKFTEVTDAIDASQDTGKGTKADIKLIGKGGETDIVGNISIKEDKGFRWASIGGLVKQFRQNFVDKALNDKSFPIGLIPNLDAPKKDRYLMQDKKTGDRVTKVVIENFPDIEDPKFIFGTDDPKTVIVGQNFRDEHFSFDNSTNTLTIEAAHIFTSMDQIKGSDFEPKFTIEQHRDNPYGLDFRIVPAFKARLSSAGRSVDYNLVM